MILGTSEYGSLKRKHSGKADVEVNKYIPEMIKRAGDNFEELIRFKEKMKEIETSKKIMAKLIGDMYLNEEIISDTQMSIIRKEFQNPSYNYGTPENNLWTLFNAVTVATRESNAKDYIKVHQDLSDYVVGEFGIITKKELELI